MRDTILAALLIAGCWALPTGAQANREEPVPSSEADPQEIEPESAESSPEQLERKALEAMQSGRYKKAVRHFEELLDRRPNEPRVLYNLACALSRTGELEEAEERLEASWRAGLRDPELLETDPDLEALRESRRGGALIDRLVAEELERLRLQGVPQLFEAPTLGGVRVVAPDPLETESLYPLVLSLHGHGGTAEYYAGLFESSGVSLEAIAAAPYGPYPVALSRGHGYSWYPPVWLYRQLQAAGSEAGPLREQEGETSRRYVLAAIESVRQSHPVDPERIYLLGHSEGAWLAWDLVLAHPELFHGVIVIAGRFPSRDDLAERLAVVAETGLRALICHSPEDQAIDIEHSERAQRTLREAGIESRLVRYRGGHGITADLARQVAKWISRESSGD